MLQTLCQRLQLLGRSTGDMYRLLLYSVVTKYHVAIHSCDSKGTYARGSGVNVPVADGLGPPMALSVAPWPPSSEATMLAGSWRPLASMALIRKQPLPNT